MPSFLAIFIGTATAREKAAWDAMDPDQRQAREQEAMAAWGRWMQDHEDAIIDPGGPIGPTKRAPPGGIEHTTNQITGYVLVEAVSHAAAEIFRDYPRFALFPGIRLRSWHAFRYPATTPDQPLQRTGLERLWLRAVRLSA